MSERGKAATAVEELEAVAAVGLWIVPAADLRA